MKRRILLVILAMGLAPAAVRADVKPHALCGEGMVLQQQSQANVWGTADQARKSHRDIPAARKRVDHDRCRPGEVAGFANGRHGHGGCTSVRDDHRGQQLYCLQERSRRRSLDLLRAIEHGTSSVAGSATRAIKECRQVRAAQSHAAQCLPSRRACAIDSANGDTSGTWTEAKPDDAGRDKFTAVGYFFGRNLQEARQVPVGLIHTSWGGTRIEAWMSEALALALCSRMGEAETQTAEGRQPQRRLGAVQRHDLSAAQLPRAGSDLVPGRKQRGQGLQIPHPSAGHDRELAGRFSKTPRSPFYFVQLATLSPP